MVIFYADDDREDCELFREALAHIDTAITCITAKDGREALNYLDHCEQLPDYIFLDINMPLVDGKQCLVEIKKSGKLKEIPVVMYSTTSDTNEIKEYYKLGAHDFLIKPNNFVTLCESLDSIFSFSKRKKV